MRMQPFTRPANEDCDCQAEKEVRVFFHPEAKNHPGNGAGETPNWFYYWMQTGAAEGLAALYSKVITSPLAGDSKPQGQYNYAEDAIYLSDAIYSGRCFPRSAKFGGGKSGGIDCMAEILRHENQHKLERWEWWGAANPVAEGFIGRPGDPDYDLVPTEVETGLAKERDCDPHKPYSCSGRPNGYVKDMEMNAYNVGWGWQRGDAKAEDWACDESQWTGGACP